MSLSIEAIRNLASQKTYLPKEFVHYLGGESGSECFVLNQKAFIQRYLNIVVRIHQESDDRSEQTFSLIPYIFSSPTFKVLLNETCSQLSEEVYGYYDPQMNLACLNMRYPIQSSRSANSLEMFDTVLAELIRHEFRHAFKTISHAHFPKRPEVVLPCWYHTHYLETESSEACPFLSPECFSERYRQGHTHFFNFMKYTSVENGKFNTYMRLFSHPLYPFPELERYKFMDAFRLDVDSILKLNASDSALNLIAKRYQPILWDGHPYLTQKPCLTEKNCVEIELGNNDFFDETTLPFYFDSARSLPNATTTFGYFVKNPNTERALAFVKDLMWRLHSVKTGYLPSLRPAEYDAWQSYDQRLRDRFFTRSERLAREDFLKFDHRNTVLKPICDSSSPSFDMKSCVQTVCRTDSILIESLTDVLSGSFRATAMYDPDVNCSDYFDKSCFLNYVINHVKINMSDTDFRASLNLPHCEQWKSLKEPCQSSDLQAGQCNVTMGPQQAFPMNDRQVRCLEETSMRPFHMPRALSWKSSSHVEKDFISTLQGINGHFFVSPSWCLGTAFVLGIGRVVLAPQLARIRKSHNMALFSDLGEWALRMQCPKDVSLVENTVRQIIPLCQNSERLSPFQDADWNFALTPLQMGLPIDLNSVRQCLKGERNWLDTLFSLAPGASILEHTHQELEHKRKKDREQLERERSMALCVRNIQKEKALLLRWNAIKRGEATQRVQTCPHDVRGLRNRLHPSLTLPIGFSDEKEVVYYSEAILAKPESDDGSTSKSRLRDAAATALRHASKNRLLLKQLESMHVDKKPIQYALTQTYPGDTQGLRRRKHLNYS